MAIINLLTQQVIDDKFFANQTEGETKHEQHYYNYDAS